MGRAKRKKEALKSEKEKSEEKKRK